MNSPSADALALAGVKCASCLYNIKGHGCCHSVVRDERTDPRACPHWRKPPNRDGVHSAYISSTLLEQLASSRRQLSS